MNPSNNKRCWSLHLKGYVCLHGSNFENRNIFNTKLTTSSRFSLLILTISPRTGIDNPKQNTTTTKTQGHQFLQKQYFLLHKHIANRITGRKNVNMKHLFSFRRKLPTAIVFPIIHSCFASGTFIRSFSSLLWNCFLTWLQFPRVPSTESVYLICFVCNVFFYKFVGVWLGRRTRTVRRNATTTSEEESERFQTTDVDRLLGWNAN